MKLLVWFSLVWACVACGSGGGDSSPEAMPDAMPAATSVPIGLTFETADGTLTSVGWTGALHDIKGAPAGSFAVNVTSCANGVCQFQGPTDPVGPVNPAGTVNRRRCLQQTGKTCTTDGDCPLDQNGKSTPCVFIYDSPISLPLKSNDIMTNAEEVGACGFTYIPVKDMDNTPAVQGTLNLSSGALNLNKLAVKLTLNFTPTFTFRGVCPVCVGDTAPNDGVREGTCQTSPLPPDANSQSDRGVPSDQGARCDVNRYGDHPGYNYAYSMDCSPTPPPSIIRPTDFGGSFSSSGFKIAITDQSPTCGDPDFKDANCFCGMCSNAATPTVCMSDANCGNGGSCLGASVPTTPLPPDNIPVAGNVCDGGACTWNEAEGVGTCTSTRLGGKQVNCYPSATMGTKGPDGKDVAITAPGRATVQNHIYYADTASARCTGASPVSTLNRQVGLPGLTLQKRNFRIIPVYAEAQQ